MFMSSIAHLLLAGGWSLTDRVENSQSHYATMIWESQVISRIIGDIAVSDSVYDKGREAKEIKSD